MRNKVCCNCWMADIASWHNCVQAMHVGQGDSCCCWWCSSSCHLTFCSFVDHEWLTALTKAQLQGLCRTWQQVLCYPPIPAKTCTSHNTLIRFQWMHGYFTHSKKIIHSLINLWCHHSLNRNKVYELACMCEAQDELTCTIAVSFAAALLWHCLSVCITITVAFATIAWVCMHV